MNISKLANTAVSVINPNDTITLILYKEQDNTGARIQTVYHEPMILEANVQPANSQDLKHLDGYSQTTIYRNFYIHKNFEGFNLGIGIGQSKIIHDGVEFFIVAVKDDYKTGWTCLMGAQNTQGDR